jgi:hypothetical protein
MYSAAFGISSVRLFVSFSQYKRGRRVSSQQNVFSRLKNGFEISNKNEVDSKSTWEILAILAFKNRKALRWM